MAVVISLLAALAVGLAGRAGLGALYAARLRTLRGLAEHPGAQAAIDDAEPLNRPFGERVLQPVLRGLGGLLGRLLPRRLLAEMAARLEQGGSPSARPADWVAAQALVAMGLAGYALLLTHATRYAALLVPVCLVLGWNVPTTLLRARSRRRLTAIRDDLPDAMDLLTVCVEAGLGFDQALQRVVDRFPGPVGQEFGRVLRDQRLGTPRRLAMLAAAERCDLPELRAFVHALLQAEELGVRIGTVLRVQSDSLREQRRQRAEESAMKAPIKMAFPMIMLILPALFLVILGPAVIEAIRTLHGRIP